MRLAGELFKNFNREKKLSQNRENLIGYGSYGQVYPSDVAGNVMKEKHQYSGADDDYVAEADLQAIAAELGMAPRVAGVETFRGGIGDRIEMADARPNFEARKSTKSSQWPTGRDAVRVNQQLGQLALKGVDLDDRHNGNVMYNKMTGRPLQLDFGKARRVEGEDQVAALTNATEAGLAAAGLGDVAEIYSATVYDLLAGGDVAEAMDVAKQGFSRLQKL
jgi:hypothetical protein